MRKIENKLSSLLKVDIGLLILRLSVATLMLFHGAAKISHGVDGIAKGLVAKGLPEFLVYGVYIGEIIVPFLLIIGLFTRLASVFMAGTMAIAIWVAYSSKLFVLSKFGAPIIESPLMFLLIAVTLMFTGAGKYSLDHKAKY